MGYPRAVGSAGSAGEDAVQSQARSSCRNFDSYRQIACGIQEKGHGRDMQQCCAKIKLLRQVYQKAREANPHSGVAPKTCCFCKKLHAILGGNTTATNPWDASGGLEATASGDSPEDKVVDEEVELEEDVGRVTESSGGVAKQGLFLTPEGSSQSQHSGSGVHEG
ncbi:hypothetical protein UY3_06232 [Chelonia mydas]|uniref:Myb/SANT-like DNA-binding domain-containing protein n=1 Tax=Chelonia mydas TaxID=8469 RepID=M7BWU3_CHEMY|nr:hypothetical protein UY3_06232 [Chelonia mydas]